MKLTGQVALVAGASGGIGRAVAERLAGEGAQVALLARDEEGLAVVAARIRATGGTALPIPADAEDEGAAARAVEETLARFGRLDCLVLAQGTGAFGPVEESRLDDWDRMLRANLTATYLLTRAALPPMLRAGRGTVVAIVSLAAVRPIPGTALYTASKAGVLGFTRALAAEVRGRGIRVAAVCPGAVDTPFWDTIPSPPDRARMLRPEAVADAVVLIATQPPEAFVEEVVLAPTPGVL